MQSPKPTRIKRTRQNRKGIRASLVDTSIRRRSNTSRHRGVAVPRSFLRCLVSYSMSIHSRRPTFLRRLFESIGLMVWTLCTHHFLMRFVTGVVNSFGAQKVGDTNLRFHATLARYVH